MLSMIPVRFRLLGALGACAIILGCGSSGSSDDDSDGGDRGGSGVGGGTGGDGTGGGGTGGGGTGGGTPATEAEIADFARGFESTCTALCEKDRDCNPYDLSAAELAEEYEWCVEDCAFDDSEEDGDGEDSLGFALTRECLAALPAAYGCIEALTCAQLTELYAWDDESDGEGVPPYCATQYSEVAQVCVFDFDFDDEDWVGEEDEEFVCGDGETIPAWWVCDGDPDCDDGSDEFGCNNVPSPDAFTCGDGSTIPGDWMCDGEEDCEDGSDEAGC